MLYERDNKFAMLLKALPRCLVQAFQAEGHLFVKADVSKNN